MYIPAHFFLVFEIIKTTRAMPRPIKIKAHHIPALKIVSIAPQLLKITDRKIKDTNSGNFMVRWF
jgi:hypothetical protein